MRNPDLLTTTEAARLVRRSAETIIRWILHGGLEAVRVNGRYLVNRQALLARMERVQTPAPIQIPASAETEEILRRHGLA